MIIYCAENKSNGKRYIGRTKYSLEFRKKQHLSKAANSPNCVFHLALSKYGPGGFDWFVVATAATEEELIELEPYYVELARARTHQHGYNTHRGGQPSPTPETIAKGIETKRRNGYRHSDETRTKMSKSKLGDGNPMKRSEVSSRVAAKLMGKKSSETAIEKRSKSMKEFWATRDETYREEFSRRMSKAATEKYSNPVEREKISAALKGKPKSADHREAMARVRTIVIPEETLNEMVKLKRAGATYEKLSEQFGYSISKIWKEIHGLV